MRKRVGWLLALSSWLLVAGAVRAESFRVRVTSDDELSTYHGTAFAIEKRLALTCWHTIDGRKTVHVEDVDGSWLIARVVAFDAAEDVALLEVPRAEFKALRMAPAVQLRVPGSKQGQRIETEAAAEKRVTVRCSAEIGMSGSPVLDAEGRCLGMVYAVNLERTEAHYLSAAALQAFLDAHKKLTQRRKDAKGTE